MKASKIDFLKRSSILGEDNKDLSKYKSLALFYEEKGRFYDALQLYVKIKDKEAMERIKELVLKDGDFFLYEQIVKVLDILPDMDEYKRLAAFATEKGKDVYAKRIEDEVIKYLIKK